MKKALVCAFAIPLMLAVATIAASSATDRFVRFRGDVR